MKTSTFLGVALAVLSSTGLTQRKADRKAAKFAEPERLYSQDRFLNEVEEMLYPSPVLIDIDRDGKLELVCGDLWGNLRVYERAAQKPDTKWGAAKLLEAEGKPLEVPNW